MEPSASSIGSCPFQLSSIRLPRASGSGPEIVPVASRSPVRRLAPFTVRCATCCAIDQYRWRVFERATTVPFSSTSSGMSYAQGSSRR